MGPFRQNEPVNNITADELRDRMKSGEELVIIDVREPWEVEEFNIGGTNIPLHDLEARISELEPYRKSTMVLYCRSGNRSVTALRLLQRHGFEKLLNLEGGVKAW